MTRASGAATRKTAGARSASPAPVRSSAVQYAAQIPLLNKTYLAKGKRGLAYTARLGTCTVLVKETNPTSAVNTIASEARMLQLVNTKGIGPSFIELRGDALIREFIDGQEMLDWMPTAQPRAIIDVLVALLEQCRALDLLGVNKLEMTHPQKHILLQRQGRHDVPVMIDFDRSKIVTRPKNITQYLQWITSTQMTSELANRGIELPRERLRAHAKDYKLRAPDNADIYGRLKELVDNAAVSRATRHEAHRAATHRNQ